MIRSLFDENNETDADESKPAKVSSNSTLNLFDPDPLPPNAAESDIDETRPKQEAFVITEAEPESIAEIARKSGLAWSAGIVLFGSIAFMMLLGWGADLLLGTSPWGMVGGIVLGAGIGFFQLFRLTSQIFRK